MHITSSFHYDFPQPKVKPGSYEWWYFDAMSSDEKWQLVVIFYQGCPFSPKYNRKPDINLAENHPAISISLYHFGKPVFYSMTEYPAGICSFTDSGKSLIEIKVGDNILRMQRTDNGLRHKLSLNERFPSGDALEGTVLFESPLPSVDLKASETENNQAAHQWNLTQPEAAVQVDLKLESKKEKSRLIRWSGAGYHDHNLGTEPMKNEFTDWYWGRFHFERVNLVFYLMRTRKADHFHAWVLNKTGNVIDTIHSGRLEDYRSNVFLLSCARKIVMESEKSEITIQKSHILDSGPFYYRFRSEAFLHIPGERMLQQGRGITEYIRPSRIHNKMFWPLIHMRYRYFEKPHWVQKSPIMYRWTW